MRDGRVAQQTLEVGLHNAGDIADGQRHNGQHNQHVLPVERQRQQAFNQNAQRHRERSNLRGAGNQQRHGRRRALVHVRHPHVERCHTQLEAEPGNDEHYAEHENRLVDLAVLDGVKHLAQFQRAGGAIQHRHAIQQQARGQRTQDEILHGRFGRHVRTATQRNQCVRRQRQQFKAQIEHEEVVAGDHHHLAAQCEQGEHVELTRIHVTVGQIAARVHQRGKQRQRTERRQHVGHRIDHRHVAEDVVRLTVRSVQRKPHRQHQRNHQRNRIGHAASFLAACQVNPVDGTNAQREKNDWGKSRNRGGRLHSFFSLLTASTEPRGSAD